MNITINRLDYLNPTDNGLKMLPQLTSLDQIEDINEVESIRIYGDKNQLETLKSNMPKSHGWQINKWSDGTNTGHMMSVRFNTFWNNNTTGDKNESAINRRQRVIKKLKQLI